MYHIGDEGFDDYISIDDFEAQELSGDLQYGSGEFAFHSVEQALSVIKNHPDNEWLVREAWIYIRRVKKGSIEEESEETVSSSEESLEATFARYGYEFIGDEFKEQGRSKEELETEHVPLEDIENINIDVYQSAIRSSGKDLTEKQKKDLRRIVSRKVADYKKDPKISKNEAEEMVAADILSLLGIVELERPDKIVDIFQTIMFAGGKYHTITKDSVDTGKSFYAEIRTGPMEHFLKDFIDAKSKIPLNKEEASMLREKVFNDDAIRAIKDLITDVIINNFKMNKKNTPKKELELYAFNRMILEFKAVLNNLKHRAINTQQQELEKIKGLMREVDLKSNDKIAKLTEETLQYFFKLDLDLDNLMMKLDATSKYLSKQIKKIIVKGKNKSFISGSGSIIEEQFTMVQIDLREMIIESNEMIKKVHNVSDVRNIQQKEGDLINETVGSSRFGTEKINQLGEAVGRPSNVGVYNAAHDKRGDRAGAKMQYIGGESPYGPTIIDQLHVIFQEMDNSIEEFKYRIKSGMTTEAISEPTGISSKAKLDPFPEFTFKSELSKDGSIASYIFGMTDYFMSTLTALGIRPYKVTEIKREIKKKLFNERKVDKEILNFLENITSIKMDKVFG